MARLGTSVLEIRAQVGIDVSMVFLVSCISLF